MSTLEATAKSIVIGSFRGAFARFQEAAFCDLKAAGFAPNVSHLIADDYGSDIGNAMRNGDDFGTKIAKAKKDGESRISLAGKGSTTMTNTMSLLRVCQVTSGLAKEKLLKSHRVNQDSLSDEIQHYLDKVNARVAATTFEQ